MTMAYVLLGMAGISVLYALWAGTGAEVGLALVQGAQRAVDLGISMAGMLCLWTGLTEIMKRSGLMEKLAAFLHRPLSFLFGKVAGDKTAMEYIAANVSANVLGLGNAATPLSIRAGTRIQKLAGGSKTASDALCMLVVLNAGSIQVIPATIAAVRAQAGANTPFDILPQVWFATVLSCVAGVVAAKVFARVWGPAK